MTDYKNCDTLLAKLWEQYSGQNPAAKKIHELFTNKGETVVNDHIAFRTFNHPEISIDKLAKAFINCGYQVVNDYVFEEKKLYAKHYEHAKIKDMPRIFISELLVEKLSEKSQRIIQNAIGRMKLKTDTPLVLQGNVWELVSYAEYESLRQESEYAAWLYVHGFKTNHFTVSVNHLKSFGEVQKVNDFLRKNGYTMNNPKQEIQGNPDALLEQSSVKAELQLVDFKDGNFSVPGCYYEFAKRYKQGNGELFSGFIAKSADKIFESTDYYKKQQKK